MNEFNQREVGELFENLFSKNEGNQLNLNDVDRFIDIVETVIIEEDLQRRVLSYLNSCIITLLSTVSAENFAAQQDMSVDRVISAFTQSAVLMAAGKLGQFIEDQYFDDYVQLLITHHMRYQFLTQAYDYLGLSQNAIWSLLIENLV